MAIRIRVASRFRRLAYAMVAGPQIVAHPCCRKPDTIIEKLMQFHEEHATPMAQLLGDLDAAAAQIPGAARTREAQPLAQRLERIDKRRGHGPKLIRDVLVQLRAKLGGVAVESKSSEDQVPA